MKTIAYILAFVVLASLGLAADCGGPVQCQCGDTLVTSQVMWYDLVGCPEEGLFIDADGITLDCGNHSISGQGTQPGIGFGEYPSSVSIQNCRISNFENGIEVNGEGHTFGNNALEGNGNAGILIYWGNHNQLVGNTFRDNGYGLYLA
jgi:hypothetical protein